MDNEREQRVIELGWANGWGDSCPSEYLRHSYGCEIGEPHDVHEEQIGRCAYRYTCKTCGITWKVDSSD